MPYLQDIAEGAEEPTEDRLEGVAKQCECLNAAKTSFHYSILKSLKVVYFF